MLAVLLLGGVVAWLLSSTYGQQRLATGLGTAFLASGLLAYRLGPGTAISRYVLTTLAFAMVGLHIQVSLGNLQYHFGVFVTLAFLLAYQDWRVIVYGAGLIALHHIVFDRLQWAGAPVYCLSTPDMRQVFEHAGFVVAQTTAQVVIAVGMARATHQGLELRAIVAAVSERDNLSLDVSQVPVRTPMALQLQDALGRVRQALQDVRHVADDLATASDDIAAANRDLRSRTNEAADSLRVTSTAVDQLASRVADGAASAREAVSLAAVTGSLVRQGEEEVTHVVDTMAAIRDGARNVSDIACLIDSIAFQTGILALNATIEAAHAGAQGRGFAVVASEVRALAQRTAAAAGQIHDLIETSDRQIETGSQLVEQAGSTMGRIAASIQQVSDMMTALTEGANDSALEIEQVNRAVGDLDRMTQQNSAMAEGSARATNSLHQQARRLSQVLAAFDDSLHAPAAKPRKRPDGHAGIERSTGRLLPVLSRA